MANGHGGQRPGSGRKPGKISAAKLDIAERAKTHGEAALATLVTVMNDKEAPAASRIAAANAILDRGYGRPMQAVEMTGKDGNPIQTEDTTHDAAAFARRMAGLAAGVDGGGAGEADAGDEG